MDIKTRQYWNDYSDEYYKSAYADSILETIQNDPSHAFPGETFEMIKMAFPDLTGKRVLVASSGDNVAVFGFHLLGAEVTSTDLSEKQLENAEKLASARGWNIKFATANSKTLDGITDRSYDLVYTSNGVHVWISDLVVMYQSFNRVLKDGGHYIFFETHPFIRPFDDSGSEIKIIKPYEDIGPFGDPPEYAWRIQDFMRALIANGFEMRDFVEFHPQPDDCDDWWYNSQEKKQKDNYAKFDWRKNSWAALPQWVGVCARKNMRSP
jgi:ubiquinone/menaquinone biosynthesis C-methylase UbiE